jgi:PsbP-like protein
MQNDNIAICIFIVIDVIAVLLIGTQTGSWNSLHPFLQARSERTTNNSLSGFSASDNITTTNSSDRSVTFHRFIDSLCNITTEGASERNGIQQPRFLTYLNPYYGIVIDYPSSWAVKQSNASSQDGKPFSVVTFSPPLSSDPNAETNLQVWVENLKDPQISLDDYAKNIIKSYRENNSNFSLIQGNSTGSTIANGYPSYYIVFTDHSNNLERKSIETGTISNVSKNAYYITFNTDMSLYDKFEPIVKRMIDSFGIYDYRSSSDEEQHGKTYVQGYNDGLDRMIAALCQPSARSTEILDEKQ